MKLHLLLPVILAAALDAPALANPGFESPVLLAMGGSSSDNPNASPLEKKGRRLYDQACYKCHGPGAVSGGTIPDLRRFKGSDENFLVIVRDGKQSGGMPAWKEFLSDDEIRAIRAFVKSVPVEP